MVNSRALSGIGLMTKIRMGRGGVTVPVLMELALSAGFEFEKFCADEDVDAEVLTLFGRSLRLASSGAGAAFAFGGAACFQPFRKLAVSEFRNPNAIQIQQFMSGWAQRVESFDVATAKVAEAQSLIDFCGKLYTVLADQVKAETKLANDQWRLLDAKATGRVTIK